MPKTKPAFTVPRLSCDCHTHVFGPYSRFPLHAGRTYSPPEAPLEMLVGFLDRLQLERVVIVQPSVYGTDNSATLDAVRQLGDRGRGVAVIDPGIDDKELEGMHKAGVRGIRINLMMSDQPSPEVATALLERQARKIRPFGWHVQLFAPMGLLVRMHRTLSSLQVKVVLDHFGWRQPETGADELNGLCALAESGNVYVKLSAAYRLSHTGFDDPAIAGLASRLIAERPRALLWGSDWPHPGAFASGRPADAPAPLHDIDDGVALNSFAGWARDADTIKRILVENPAKLYEFT
ncbi:amidohydrolase family protein [Bradyrhizobium cenepequi]|uniref:amidohydrolase family protein n=1 Tax=Bradyrhizobium cenepequi TaxID=2821403 RepID=UPI001CE2A957|nr:amidohydrolase family protein [Bradyrhizobium cenepequi]MCA6108446.1 amidohydrolase family protein [Bradyrhizobium cenepequi]